MKRMMIIGALALLASCAKAPEKIQAVAVDESAYANLTCQQLAAQRSSYKSDYDALAQQQNNTATADAVGVLFLGVPGGSLAGGDKETPIAVLKGKMAALNAVAVRKKCSA